MLASFRGPPRNLCGVRINPQAIQVPRQTSGRQSVGLRMSSGGLMANACIREAYRVHWKALSYAAGEPSTDGTTLVSGVIEQMSDETTTVAELRELLREFVAERDWEQFHSPKNISMALAIEAAELMEHFQWIDVAASRNIGENAQRLADVGEELADVVSYALAMANALGIDVADTVRDKMKKNALKYPAEEFRGRYGPRDDGR